MKINYLFTSIVALALLAACDNNPQRINSNQNVSYNNLNAAAIAALFNDLPTLTGKTIRITGCLGAADTSNDAIATGKGWTINRAT